MTIYSRDMKATIAHALKEQYPDSGGAQQVADALLNDDRDLLKAIEEVASQKWAATFNIADVEDRNFRLEIVDYDGYKKWFAISNAALVGIHWNDESMRNNACRRAFDALGLDWHKQSLIQMIESKVEALRYRAISQSVAYPFPKG